MRAQTHWQSVASLDSLQSADLNDYLSDKGLELDPEKPDHIRWTIDSPLHPRQWTASRKAYNVCFIVLYEAFEAASSTSGASAAIQARHELGCSRMISYLAFTTMFIIGEGLAGLIFPPLSESFGRKWQFVLSSALFCLFTGLTSFNSLPAICVVRLLSGFVGGVPPSVSPGALEDLFSREQQVWAIFAWATASNTGLVVGPIASSYLVEALGWRWVFYIGAIYGFFIFLLSLFFFESRPNLLLTRAIKDAHRDTGFIFLKFNNPDHHPTWHGFVAESLTRPMRLLFSEPPIIIASMLNALAFGLIYILTEALSIIYTAFGLSEADTSLAFIPVLIGIWLSTLLRIFDHKHLERLRKTGRAITPEHKITSLLVSAPLLLAGLWIFAWTIPPALSNGGLIYLISMAALIPIGIASNDFDAVIAGYLVDCYGDYANSAFAAVTWTRAIVSIIFSLVTDPMYRALGNNVASTICAAGAVVVCGGAIGLWKYGSKFRERSAFARQGDTDGAQMDVAWDGRFDASGSDGVGFDGGIGGDALDEQYVVI